MSDRMTGRMRYRIQKRLFREPLLVLQFEWKTMISIGFDFEHALRWHDATFEDLQAYERSQNAT
ncbi:hypothetical protein RPALISO_197 [Ruegeria phage RpAliso]|nr:hypothetical protein RPALISO_197 [Ruegeria phage RpAliso]